MTLAHVPLPSNGVARHAEDRIDLYAVREALGLRNPEAWHLFTQLLCSQSKAVPPKDQVFMALRTVDALRDYVTRTSAPAIHRLTDADIAGVLGHVDGEPLGDRPQDTPPDSPI